MRLDDAHASRRQENPWDVPPEHGPGILSQMFAPKEPRLMSDKPAPALDLAQYELSDDVKLRLMTIGAHLTLRMVEKGLTALKLAQRLGVDVTLIHRIMTGEAADVPVGQLFRFAEAVGAPLVMGMVQQPQAPQPKTQAPQQAA